MLSISSAPRRAYTPLLIFFIYSVKSDVLIDPDGYCNSISDNLKSCTTTTPTPGDADECKTQIFQTTSNTYVSFCQNLSFKNLLEAFSPSTDIFDFLDCSIFANLIFNSDNSLNNNFQEFMGIMNAYDCDSSYNMYSPLWNCTDCIASYMAWSCLAFSWLQDDFSFSCIKGCQKVMETCPILQMQNDLESSYLFDCPPSRIYTDQETDETCWYAN